MTLLHFEGIFCFSLKFSHLNLYRPEACNFIKKETLAQVFSCEFCEIFKNNFFTEHLRTTAYVFCVLKQWKLRLFMFLEKYYKKIYDYQE